VTNWWNCEWTPVSFNFQTRKQIRQKGGAAASEGSPRHEARTQELQSLGSGSKTVQRRFPFERNSAAWTRSHGGSESQSNVGWNHKMHLISKLLVLKQRCVPSLRGFESQNHAVLRLPMPCRPANDVMWTTESNVALIPPDSRVAA
jgi:hypothetical protein